MIKFWNGNKSHIRQKHELFVTQKILETVFPNNELIENKSNYSTKSSEGQIFKFGFDITTTISGNTKFIPNSFLEIPISLCGDSLGFRNLLVNKNNASTFHFIEENKLQHLRAGLPSCWLDKEIFKFNGYNVKECASIEHGVALLKAREIDYIPLGKAEIPELLSKNSFKINDFYIVESTAIYYDLPVVYYISPERYDIYTTFKKECENLKNNNMLCEYKNIFYTDVKCNEKIISLVNPFLRYDPETFTLG